MELRPRYSPDYVGKAKVEAVATLLGNLAGSYNGLASERSVDQKSAVTVSEKTPRTLLGAAFVSYISAFGSAFRKRLTTDFWIADLVVRNQCGGIERSICSRMIAKKPMAERGPAGDRIRSRTAPSSRTATVASSSTRSCKVYRGSRSHEARLKVQQTQLAEKLAAEQGSERGGVSRCSSSWREERVFRVTEAIRNGDRRRRS